MRIWAARFSHAVLNREVEPQSLIFTSSWDDGHPLDSRVADLLSSEGLRGTFFVPIRNSEGRPVLRAAELRSIAGGHEIGSHTLDHIYLTTLPPAQREQQIVRGKKGLEDLLGAPVDGFCYPGGAYDSRVKKLVIRAGFSYARTIENLRTDCGDSRFELPTTMQFYPHSRAVLMRNYLRHARYARRIGALLVSIRASSWTDRLRGLLEIAAMRGGVCHVWGHSWEIEELGLWDELRAFFRLVASLQATSKVVKDVAGLVRGAETY